MWPNGRRHSVWHSRPDTELIQFLLLADYAPAVFQKFGYGQSRAISKATFFELPYFPINPGTYYFFALHKSGNYDRLKFKVVSSEIEDGEFDFSVNMFGGTKTFEKVNFNT